MSYTLPNLDDPKDRLAHFLSELHNDNAPLGWERYRFLASVLLDKFPLVDVLMDDRFSDPHWQPGKSSSKESA